MSTEGTLYTYTTREFPPPLPYKGNRNPKVFEPYVVGFVELAEGVLVETLIVEVTPAELQRNIFSLHRRVGAAQGSCGKSRGPT